MRNAVYNLMLLSVLNLQAVGQVEELPQLRADSLLLETTDIPPSLMPAHAPPIEVLDAQGFIDEDNLWLQDEATLSNRRGADLIAQYLAMHRLPAPVLTLRATGGCKANPSWALQSTDVPGRWATLPSGRVELTVELPEGLLPDKIELTLDNQPLDARIDTASSPVRVQLPCLALGRHIVQGRYLSLNKWSTISAPLRLEIRKPRRPQIEAVGDATGPLTPIEGTAEISSDSLRMRLSHVEPQGEVFAYLNGEHVLRTALDQDCCLTVPLREHIAPGMHWLAVRSTACSGACSIASDASRPVRIHYLGAKEDHVIARPKWVTPNGVGINSVEAGHEKSQPQSATATPIEPTPVPPNPEPSKAPEEEVVKPSDDNETPGDPLPSPGGTSMGLNPIQLLIELTSVAILGDERSWNSEPAPRDPAPTVQPSAGPEPQVDSAPSLETEPEVPTFQRMAPPENTSDFRRPQFAMAPQQLQTYTFTSPANFPRHGFGLRGESLERDGVLIYEGMQLTVNEQNGDYIVTMFVSSAPVPVDLQLQLKVRTSRGAWHTLTLKPVCLLPADRCADPKKVEFTGRSERLRQCETILEVKRVGVARFNNGRSGQSRHFTMHSL